MINEGKIQIGYSDHPVLLDPAMAMRHGLIAGATGTGKSTTLKVLAEGFSDLGVPVFLVDAKGDLSSLAAPGKMTEAVKKRIESAGITTEAFELKEFPVRFWDVFQKQGVPLRITVSDLGPGLFSRLMNLTPAQSGVMQIVFKAADDRGWQLDDLKDLKAMLRWVQDNRAELQNEYGAISSTSAAAILRALLELENQKAEAFFGLPAIEAQDLLSTTEDRGTINILEASELLRQPLLYSAFMLWLLAELNEILPEAGALDKPRLALFFDEAHMIFDDAPKALVDQIAQTVRLIRSKGVAVFFITQSPSDLPADVLSQLSNRIVHSLHAYTPEQTKGLKAAAQGFRINPAFKTLDELQQLGTGWALVSCLDQEGVPEIVQKTMILPCQSSFDALSPQTIARFTAMDPIMDKYGESIDPRSAYEILSEAQQEQMQMEAQRQAELEQEKERERMEKEERSGKSSRKKQSSIQKAVSSAAKSTARSIGRQSARAITRSVLGSQSKSVSRAAQNFAGSLPSSLIGNLFK